MRYRCSLGEGDGAAAAVAHLQVVELHRLLLARFDQYLQRLLDLRIQLFLRVQQRSHEEIEGIGVGLELDQHARDLASQLRL